MTRGKIQQGEEGFPAVLAERAPDVKTLYFEGDPALLGSLSIAVVGSRKCTRYGKTVAQIIGKKLGENGVTLVSGLARGIDSAGHLGALAAGGKTIAVLGGGPDHVYPAQNREIYEEIAEKGLILSEHPPGYRARPYDFPLRNRIISALSESIVVVEAADNSGALITAEYAMEQGKRVYAVPGNITSYYSMGTNKLLRDRAEPLVFIDDLLLDLGKTPDVSGAMAELGEAEKRIFSVISSGGEMTIDEIHHKTNMKLSEINGIITILEMKGVIFSSLGKFFVAKF